MHLNRIIYSPSGIYSWHSPPCKRAAAGRSTFAGYANRSEVDSHRRYCSPSAAFRAPRRITSPPTAAAAGDSSGGGNAFGQDSPHLQQQHRPHHHTPLNPRSFSASPIGPTSFASSPLSALPSGFASTAPAAATALVAATPTCSTLLSTSCTGSSPSSSVPVLAVGGTVLRTIDSVIAAASASRAAIRTSTATAAPAATNRGTGIAASSSSAASVLTVGTAVTADSARAATVDIPQTEGTRGGNESAKGNGVEVGSRTDVGSGSNNVSCGSSSRSNHFQQAVSASMDGNGVGNSSSNGLCTTTAAAAAPPTSNATAVGVSVASGGVPLLVVVGVVLLDDPEYDMSTNCGNNTSNNNSGNSGRPVRVLLAQRPHGKANAGLWEFPGGKVDPGETPEAALVRELHEELGITVDPNDLQPLTFASHTYPTFHLLMPLYACRRWRGEPRGAEGQAVAWVTAPDVMSYELTPADVPLVPAVLAAMRLGDKGTSQLRA
ncbi:hypothetical protein Agub_g3742 [Astrephomene gubernaculifera]|uniref:8-oxo-dGTP diphosphatase n=1 Tax=Astrephomene gubernaculifera TaxID=47775 RepID=A0AAD3DJ36_9CHLO|nr:hypothetical protein Agub_g3742 [Astrephomene gubernaculifera]